MEKLGLETRADLVRWALAEGLLEPPVEHEPVAEVSAAPA
jgi:hypothetical protein